MKTFLSDLRGAVMATIVIAVVCCGIYPLLVYCVASCAFPEKANGSLIVAKDGTVRGSRLIGQGFAGEKYFHPRPSAAGNGYDGLSSGGSNLGPTSQTLNDAIKDRIDAYRKENGLKAGNAIPADAVTASASGLDPHISLRNAKLQTARVAKARRMAVEQVEKVILQYVEGPDLGVFGEPAVNVLTLNLALDSNVERQVAER
ncbi:MAG: K+-transporting ATPase, subunit [Verrucomicrobiales bacterium]|nr:K+-transporting ATPase, subunit [Verrucomicrobiales bacterium]